MYRILIVDDETYIAEGLRVSLSEELDPERFELDIAFSGREALGKFDRRPFDIVITDVRMPEMDGIDLQDRLRKGYPECKVIFLTGHGDFELIRRAFRNQGTDYILKTEGDAQVVKAILEVSARLDGERMELHRRLEEESLVSRARLAVARQAMEQFLAGDLSRAEDELRNLEPYGPVPLPASPLIVAVLEADRGDLELVLLLAGNGLREKSRFLGAVASSEEAVILYQGAEGNPPEWRTLQRFLESIQDSFQLEGKPPFSFVLEPETVPFSALGATVKRLGRVLSSRSDVVGLSLVTHSPPGGSVTQVLDGYIEAHLADDVSLSRLAEVVGLNPSYLSRLYLQETGTHLSEKIAQVRWDRALSLLADPDRKIADVARDVGFWTPSHFIRFFKKRTGLTPQAYRESLPTNASRTASR
jgi:two-component system, response regulator YesN